MRLQEDDRGVAFLPPPTPLRDVQSVTRERVDSSIDLTRRCDAPIPQRERGWPWSGPVRFLPQDGGLDGGGPTSGGHRADIMLVSLRCRLPVS